MALALGSYFLDDSTEMPQPEILLDRQRDDGGWNCRARSVRSLFHSTISVLEGLLAYERAVGGNPTLAEARVRGHEYLLERRLMYSLRTRELTNSRWLLMSFPPRWLDDVLLALDYLRNAGPDPDPRAGEAIEVIEDRGAARMVAGHFRAVILARTTSRWRRAQANRAAGTRCAPYACSAGTEVSWGEPDRE